MRDNLNKTVSVEQRSGDCDSLAERGEEGLDWVHHAGGVENLLFEERVPDLTISPILTPTPSPRQYLPTQVRIPKPNFKSFYCESCTSQSEES